jgi:MFS family permease
MPSGRVCRGAGPVQLPRRAPIGTDPEPATFRRGSYGSKAIWKEASDVAPPGPHEAPYPRPVYAWYIVGVLTVVYVFSFIDRQILNLLVGPIRRDLSITDTQMSLLSGFGFAVFYAFFGLPLGRIADSRSRRGLIAGGFALWSVFSMGCGLAHDFWRLMLMRMGIGVGEASLSPAAYSLITDYFPPHRRATAQSIYGMGIYLGSGAALTLGGLVTGWTSSRSDWFIPVIGHICSWQMVFFLVGAPGLLFALLMFTVAEPVRRGVHTGAASIPLREVLAYLKRNRSTFFCHNCGFALLFFSAYGSAAWTPTFFIRQHHWSAAQIGKSYGAIYATSGTLGIACAGRAADWLLKRGSADAYLRLAMFASWLWIPSGVAYLLVPGPRLALALSGLTVFLVAAPLGVGPAELMHISPPRMRSQTGAIYLFVANLIGLGIGPTAVALLTDYVFRDDSRVGSSLLIVSLTARVLAGLLFWAGLRPYVLSQERMQDWIPADSAVAAVGQ